jgi:hypothetical protein
VVSESGGEDADRSFAPPFVRRTLERRYYYEAQYRNPKTVTPRREANRSSSSSNNNNRRMRACVQR